MKSSRSTILEKAVLKSILPVIEQLQEWATPILLLGRISAVTYENRETKERKPKCIKCGAIYQNFLLFVLHLQLVHRNSLQVAKYEFSTDLMTIYLKDSPTFFEQQRQNHLQMTGSNEYFLCMNHQDRVRDILMTIFSKFVKRYEKQRRQYFHSTDIFREVSPQSQGQDSEEDISHLQKELQKMRISEFSDVTQTDKVFFIKWNTVMHEAKIKYVIMGHEELLDVLDDFAKIAKKEDIKRLSIIMHGWTLWSSGKLTSNEVTNFIKAYDQA